MKDREAEKVFLLDRIFDSRAILFGKFSPTITEKKKQEKWEDILLACLAMVYTLVPESTKVPWKYLRDTVWSANLKRKTLEKRDKKNKTGSDGGKELAFTLVEQKVLEILGENSAQVRGLRVEESSGQFVESASELYYAPETHERRSTHDSAASEASASGHADATQRQPIRRKQINARCSENIEELRKARLLQDMEIQELKKRKLSLQIQLLEREISK